MANKVDDSHKPFAGFEVGKDVGFLGSHPLSVGFHDGETSPDIGCEINFIDDK